MRNGEADQSRRKTALRLWWPVMAVALLAVSGRADPAVKEICGVTQIQLGSSTYGDVKNPDGQMHDKAHSATSMFLSENPLLNGRQDFVAAMYIDEEWNVVMHGIWVMEVGTWTGVQAYLDDPENAPLPEFTATSGVWVGTFEVKGNFFSLVTMRSTAHGIAGAVEGLQLKVGGEVPILGVRNYTARVLDSCAENLVPSPLQKN